MQELGKFEITVKDLATGQSRPFEMVLAEEEEEGDFLWWGFDSTEERRLSEWLTIIKNNMNKNKPS